MHTIFRKYQFNNEEEFTSQLTDELKQALFSKKQIPVEGFYCIDVLWNLEEEPKCFENNIFLGVHSSHSFIGVDPESYIIKDYK